MCSTESLEMFIWVGVTALWPYKFFSGWGSGGGGNLLSSFVRFFIAMPDDGLRKGRNM